MTKHSTPPIKAVIFDMDGLLLDTERVAQRAWKQAAGEWGYQLGDADYHLITGRVVGDTQKVFAGIFGEDFPFQDIRARRVELTDEYFARFGIPVKEGAHSLLHRLEARAIPRAVATSTTRMLALAKLQKTALADFFKVIITGDQVEHGKPAPDIFLLAARELLVEPSACLVLEDSEAGIRAAHAAGMLPLMIPDLKQPTAEIRKLTYRICNSLTEVMDLF